MVKKETDPSMVVVVGLGVCGEKILSSFYEEERESASVGYQNRSVTRTR